MSIKYQYYSNIAYINIQGVFKKLFDKIYLKLGSKWYSMTLD